MLYQIIDTIFLIYTKSKQKQLASYTRKLLKMNLIKTNPLQQIYKNITKSTQFRSKTNSKHRP